MGEEVNNKVILMLALLVVLVVTVSTWLLLNKLNTMELESKAAQPAVTFDQFEQPVQGGNLELTILPQQDGGTQNG